MSPNNEYKLCFQAAFTKIIGIISEKPCCFCMYKYNNIIRGTRTAILHLIRSLVIIADKSNVTKSSRKRIRKIADSLLKQQ